MKLVQIKYAAMTAKLKHFTNAAEICCVSQPTLSIGIKRLEDELGVLIFNRSCLTTKVTLTENGERIINQLNTILDEVEKLKMMASIMKKGIS